MFAKSIVALSLFGAATLAAPTSTTNSTPSKTALTGVTHSVVAGLGGLHFDPENIVAEIGDIVEVCRTFLGRDLTY